MKYRYVFNWKMNFTFNQTIDFCKTNLTMLRQMAGKNSLTICPSFISLLSLIDIFRNSTITIGAQNCCAYKTGAYTGEVSAQSLKEIGVSYCIIGHSERRQLFNETNDIIAQKLSVLLDNAITPIICIGETLQDFKRGKGIGVLNEQLSPIIEIVKLYSPRSIFIAYEPIWSIGTGIIPDNKYLENILSGISRRCIEQLSHHTVQLLYGGSVNEDTIHDLKSIALIDGFLIGSASTNSDQLINIMS